MKTVDKIITADVIVTCKSKGAPLTKEDLKCPEQIDNGAIAVKDGFIVKVGTLSEVAGQYQGEIIEYKDSAIVPGFVDPHTHPIFAGSRASEFVKRAQGATYEEIHAQGGGIAYTVNASRKATDAELEAITTRNLMLMSLHGTTTAEVKSGYGLNVLEEIRQLRILKKLSKVLPINMSLTFLGAHDIPEEYKGHTEDYISLVIDEMLPIVCKEELAQWIDIFCERGVFNLEQSRRILKAGIDMGLKARIHAEEFCYSGSAAMASNLGAYSVDHLQNLDPKDYSLLKKNGTIPVLTPGTSFFLGQGVYAKGRDMLDYGLPVALASDFNAGSNLTCSMAMAMSLAVLRLKFTPYEALAAATINAAYSLDLGAKTGSIEEGKEADLAVLVTPVWQDLPYYYGVNLVKHRYKKGALLQ